MINYRIILLFTAGLILVSCKNEKAFCKSDNFEELRIEPVNVVLRLPHYEVTDTVAYGDLSNIFERKIKTSDSSLVVFAGVKSYEKDPDASFDINHRMSSQKESIQFWSDSIKLITESIKTIKSLEVGYLKYLDLRKGKNRYEGRIFFYKDKKLVDIWIYEQYQDHLKDKKSVTDCILNDLQID